MAWAGGASAWRRRLAQLLLLEAALQRVHQVDHLAALGRLGDDRRGALDLRLHQLDQRLLIRTHELGGIEVAIGPFDDRLGELDHVRVELV
ncbi:MAG: hypothetical protein FJX56_01905 [Alphaproteobacteria bacterium]|nr:hypothetical protein [Alphaproteobacteria bacterium]